MTPSEQVEYYLDKEEAGEFLFPENITLFGQDIHEMTLEDVLALAGTNNWDNPNYLTLDSYADGSGHQWRTVRYNSTTAPSGWSNIFAFQKQEFWEAGYTCFQQLSFGTALNYEVREKLAPGIPMGMFDLCTGDSLETALAKMGFENAEQIAATALQMDRESDAVLFDRGYSGEELEVLPAGKMLSGSGAFYPHLISIEGKKEKTDNGLRECRSADCLQFFSPCPEYHE